MAIKDDSFGSLGVELVPVDRLPRPRKIYHDCLDRDLSLVIKSFPPIDRAL